MSAKQTTPDDGSTGSSSAQWSDLPDDLLGKIRLRIASLRDHVCLAAVCRPWRATVARLPAPPAVPLLIMSPDSRYNGKKHLRGSGPDDCSVLPVLDKVADRWVVGSHDCGWIATFDFDTHEYMLLNLFSGAQVWVSSGGLWLDVRRYPIKQVAFSDNPTSSNGCILATITDHNRSIGLCKVGNRNRWTTQGWEGMLFEGITFCNGDLYGLAYPGEELIRFEISTKKDGSPMVKSTDKLAIQMRDGPTVTENNPWTYECYILELHGKPSKAVRTRWLPNREPFFKVFEIVNADAGEVYQHKWGEVTDFGDYALFLGPARSKAVHVPVGSERRGFERNHIYYSIPIGLRESYLRGDELYSLRLNNDRLMYCREDECIGDGLKRTGYFVRGWTNAPLWLHPPNL